MKLYLVRHGQSQGNSLGMISSPDTPLTERGQKDTLNLGRMILKENINFDLVLCSPLSRTRQTLGQILKSGVTISPKQVCYIDLIREINRKEFEGKAREEYYAKRDSSGVNPDDFRCKEGESENDVRIRAKEFLKYLETLKVGSILVITHGHFIKHLVELFRIDVAYYLRGASLSLIEWENEQVKVIYWDRV
ncbi:histidine phosphatase family protein [Patescibacteria group bacterium]|nr:histidine phosphatase family protein [Patescibacteria group bacterium]